MLLLAIIGGGGYFGFMHKEKLQAFVRANLSSGNDAVPVVTAARAEAAKTPGGASESESATFAAAAVTPAVTSGFGPEFLKRPVWATVKEAFPEWYDARVTEVTHLSAEGKPDDEIVRHLVEALVALEARELAGCTCGKHGEAQGAGGGLSQQSEAARPGERRRLLRFHFQG